MLYMPYIRTPWVGYIDLMVGLTLLCPLQLLYGWTEPMVYRDISRPIVYTVVDLMASCCSRLALRRARGWSVHRWQWAVYGCLGYAFPMPQQRCYPASVISI